MLMPIPNNNTPMVMPAGRPVTGRYASREALEARVKALSEEGVSQERIAKRCAVSPRTVKRILNGKR